MQIDIKPQEAQFIQSAISSQLAGLNQKRKKLGQDYHAFHHISFERYETGRIKIVNKIKALEGIVGRLEPAKQIESPSSGANLTVWEGEGGLCRD